MSPPQRVALVTGASRGIGRAIAVELARRGAALVLIGRDGGALEESVAAIGRVAPEAPAMVICADVTDAAAVAGCVDQAMTRFGRLDVAVANAGQAHDGLLMRLKPEALELNLAVNLKSAFYLCMAVSKPMMKQRSGSIVLVSSIVGLTGNAGQAAYAASKAGMLGLTKSLAKELGSRNIRVNAVAPGLIETAMTKDMSQAAREYILKQTALGRPGILEDVSGAVAFLCSDDAGYITGQTLVVDGGIVM